MILTYKYRLLPTKRQHAALAAILEDQRRLYNAALEERIDCYRKTGRTRNYMQQCAGLTEWRAVDEEAAAQPANLQRWTLKRLHDACEKFFAKRSARKRASFPRYRGASRWRAFGFNEFKGIRFVDSRLRFCSVPGSLRVHVHRPLPDGADIRSCVFRRDHKGWSVCFQVAADGGAPRPAGRIVGLDLGLSVFAYQSDGVVVPSPRVARRAEREMRRRQRAVTRCRRGSNRRQKIRAQFARAHTKVKNTRSTWLHQQSARLVSNYDLIAAEDLRVANMMKHPRLARSVADASWSAFLSMVSYKAERAGARFVTVDPRNTSQRCSGCGELVPKTLAVRTHSCPSCGLVIDRDWNAARNILAQAVAGLGADNVAQWSERRPGNIAA